MKWLRSFFSVLQKARKKSFFWEVSESKIFLNSFLNKNLTTLEIILLLELEVGNQNPNQGRQEACDDDDARQDALGRVVAVNQQPTGQIQPKLARIDKQDEIC